MMANEFTDQPVQLLSETQKHLDEAASVRYLNPEEYNLFRTPGGTLRMTLHGDRSFIRVKTRRCFPFAFPSRYISVRDGAEEEIGIIRDLDAVCPEHRAWIEEDLDMRYFTPRIKSILSVRQRWGGVVWRVETDRGTKTLITRGVHDTMSEVEPGRYVINDVDGNRYEILTSALDESSRATLNRLV